MNSQAIRIPEQGEVWQHRGQKSLVLVLQSAGEWIRYENESSEHRDCHVMHFVRTFKRYQGDWRLFQAHQNAARMEARR